MTCSYVRHPKPHYLRPPELVEGQYNVFPDSYLPRHQSPSGTVRDKGSSVSCFAFARIQLEFTFGDDRL